MELTVRDHTRIIGACMENAILLFQRLGGRQLVVKRSRPDWKAVLQVLPNVVNLDIRTGRAVAEVLKQATSVPDARKALPVEARTAAREIVATLQGRKSISGKISQLKRALATEKYRRIVDVEKGLGTAIELLVDGRHSIYSPNHPFNSTFLTAAGALGDIGGADLRGFLYSGFSISGGVVASVGAGIEAVGEAICAD